MRLDGYQIISNIILEVSTKSIVKRLAKRSFRDPVAAATTLAAIPGGIVGYPAIVPAVHMAKNPRSRNMGKLVLRKTTPLFQKKK